MKVQVEANEITNTNVQLVSMVKRGANRIPFRITKEDTTMLDLHAIGRQLYKAEPSSPTAPTVVGVFLAKGVEAQPIIDALMKADIPADKWIKSETDDAVALTKADKSLTKDNTFVMKASNDVAFVIHAPESVVKSMSTYDWESTSFSEVMSKGSFAPSLYVASEMLERTFSNIMEKADTPADLAKMLGAATDEFKAYVTQVAKSLPKTIFKAEQELATVRKSVAKKTKEVVEAVVEKAAKIEEVVEKTEVEKTAAPAVVEKQADPAPAVVERAADKQVDAMADIIKAMTEGFANIKTDMEKSVAGVARDMAALTERVEKADKAVNGIVVGSPADDKTGRVFKSEGSSNVPPPLDTAFMKSDDLGSRRK